MKIAFVYPAISESGFNINREPVIFSQIHAGLCSLSAVCKKEGYSDISLIDMRTLAGWEDFADKVSCLGPDLIGISIMSPDYYIAKQCIDVIKGINPGIKIVVGGMHPTVMTEEVKANEKVDHIITGEAEISFPKLIRDLDEGKACQRVITGQRPDVNDLPYIDRELFECLELAYDFFLPLPFVTILAGRGCGYNCKFCSPAGKLMHGYRIRRRGVENIIGELKDLKMRYGIRSFQFWDDCFTESRSWVMDFCDAYRETGLAMPFVCQTRADIVCKNPDMMAELKKAGLKMASIGFESGNDRVLKFINKGTTLKQNLEAARICGRLGIKVWAYHIYGFPTETPMEALDTVKMIKRIKPYRSSAAFFTPQPGSHFYDYCKNEHLSLIDDHDSFVRFPENDKPKIRNIDYGLMRKYAGISKDVSFSTKIRIRLERVFWHKVNKPFKAWFKQKRSESGITNSMCMLRLKKGEGFI